MTAHSWFATVGEARIAIAQSDAAITAAVRSPALDLEQRGAYLGRLRQGRDLEVGQLNEMLDEQEEHL